MNGYGKMGLEAWYVKALDAFRRELAAQSMRVRARKRGAWFVFGCPLGDDPPADVNVRMDGIAPDQLRALTILLTASCAKNGILSPESGEIVAGLFDCEREKQEADAERVVSVNPGTPEQYDDVAAPTAAQPAGRKDRLLEIPERYREGLERYVRNHVEPGGFLRCVLEDRLGDALARFDRDLGLDDLRALVSFIHNEVMWGENHGSRQAVKDWLALGGHPEKCGHCTHPGAVQWYESQPLGVR